MTENFEIRKLTSIEDMLINFSLISLLTPSLTIEKYQEYLSQMIPHNYFQVVFIMQNEIVAVSGYWIATKIYCGKYLEIDNFIVLEKIRNQGIGEKVLEWLENEGRNYQCDLMMLDAYVENYQAHRFYYRNGYVARGFHFLKPIKAKK